MRRSIVIVIGFLTACGSSAPPPPTRAERTALERETRGEFELTVRVRGLRADQGEVLVALYASERGFPGSAEHALQSARNAVSRGTAEVSFSGLARGSYAVAVLHDENTNGALDTGFLGIPSEGLGASNGAQGRFGPADFDDAKFLLASDSTIEIDVRYFP